MKIFWLIANMLAAFLDFSAGTFLVFLSSLLTGYQVQIYHYFLGGIFALIPDFVVPMIYLKKNGLYVDPHKTLLHRPLFILPATFGLSAVIGGLFWSVVATICVLWHFLHDIPTINWLWPFRADTKTKSAYLDNTERGIHREHQCWLFEIWMEKSKRAAAEITIGAILLGIVIGIISGRLWGVIFVGFFLFGAYIVQNLYAWRMKIKNVGSD